MGQITELCHSCAAAAQRKGFTEQTVPEALVLMHSELSEALEEVRNHHSVTDIRLVEDAQGGMKPEGYPTELADLAIRLFHHCGAYGIDLEGAIYQKMNYNATRPHKHGGKAL